MIYMFLSNKPSSGGYKFVEFALFFFFVFFFWGGGGVVYAQTAIDAIWRLTLRHVLKESLELKFWCENIAFVLNNKFK